MSRGRSLPGMSLEAETTRSKTSYWLDRMWGRMASAGRLVIGLCEFLSPLVARSATLGFGHSCGRQSCLQAAFQAAVSETRRISQASLHDACQTRS